MDAMAVETDFIARAPPRARADDDGDGRLIEGDGRLPGPPPRVGDVALTGDDGRSTIFSGSGCCACSSVAAAARRSCEIVGAARGSATSAASHAQPPLARPAECHWRPARAAAARVRGQTQGHAMHARARRQPSAERRRRCQCGRAHCRSRYRVHRVAPRAAAAAACAATARAS